MSMMHFLPLDKGPEVLIDRAQSILGEMGYDEPAYSDPVDQAWGLFVWSSVFGEVAETDDSAERWEGLRARPDAGSFWYRQSTAMMWPMPTGGDPVYVRGLVNSENPPPTRTGDVVVMLDLAGNLRRFQVTPKRFSTQEAGGPDWAPLFALAGLELERFEEDRPRYQRFHTPDLRRAWVGSREELPDIEMRVEAGSYEGRPTLFNVATSESYEGLGTDPEPSREPLSESAVESLEPILLLVITILSIPLARRHLKQGRADRRGAVRWAVTIGSLFAASSGLRSHLLFTREGPDQIWGLIVGGVFFGYLAWVFYIAAEPIGRRVWPSMFISLNRLLSRPRMDWRDPLIGQSVLVGLIFGAGVFAVGGPLRWSISTLREGAPSGLQGYNLNLMLGERLVLGQFVEALLSANRWFLFVVALVVLRLLLKRAWPATALTVVLWPLMIGVAIGEDLAYAVAVSAISMVVLLRWGVVSLVVTHLVVSMGWIARASDWSAWHAKPAVMAVVFVGALTVYGVWAATNRGLGGAAGHG
jgi:hypothetical protein